MALFEKGNQFWKARATHGRETLFASPSLLWEAACEYFQWCDENPLYEEKGFAFQGVQQSFEDYLVWFTGKFGRHILTQAAIQDLQS